MTSSPLPSFLLSEGTHLKNENKVIVPVLFLKSVQMLSVDRRLIVRRVAVRAGGREERHRYSSSYCSSTSAPASQRKYTHTHTHTLLHSTGKLHTQTYAATAHSTHLHGTDWHMRRGFGSNGLFGMRGVARTGWGLCTEQLN